MSILKNSYHHWLFLLQDLVYKGVIKFSYDRGYAVQTKSMLVGSDMTTDGVIDQLIDSLGLTGEVEDYELREINHMSQGD